MAERRIQTVLQTRFEAGELSGTGKIRNLGDHGLFVGSNLIPEEGEAVLVTFTVPEGFRVEVSGLVWWTTCESGDARHRTQGFGLRLLDVSDAYQRFVEGLRAKPRRAPAEVPRMRARFGGLRDALERFAVDPRLRARAGGGRRRLQRPGDA